MLSVDFTKLVNGLHDLQRAITICEQWPAAAVVPAKRIETISDIVIEVIESTDVFSLDHSHDQAAGILRMLVGIPDECGPKACSYNELAAILTVLRRTVAIELEEYKFLAVDPDCIKYLGPNLFGKAVTKSFPSTTADIQEAGRCFAYDLNTAAIFHLMRAVEIGLRSLARKLKVPISKKGAVDYAQWQQIISQIETAVNAMAQLPKGKKKSEALGFYRGILLEFTAFKDVWRNNVSHSRHSYDKHQAMSVYVHVLGFMQRLVTKVKE